MIRETLIVLVVPALFLILQSEIAEAAFRPRGGTTYNEQYRGNNYYKTPSANVAGGTNEGGGRSAPESEKQVAKGKGKGRDGISAWGIIAIIVGLVLVGTGGYYACVFYPYLCKKQRSYDMIELTDVL